MDPNRHRERRVLVTGAANGIGRAAALRFLGEGARVAALDVEADALERLSAEAGARDRLLPLGASVTDEPAVGAAVDRVVSAWGGLDVVVANAAIEPIGEDNYLHQLDAAVLRRIVEVNLVGLTLTCKHGVRALLATGGGAVVVTASPTGLYGVVPEEAAYSISKSGGVGLTRVIAAAYGAKGIRANAVIPGVIDTRANRPLHENPQLMAAALRAVPLARMGSPDEVAAVISFLASDEASYVTGALWTADGGLTAV